MTGAVILIASLALLISFVCSLCEATLYAITPAQLEVQRNQGAFGAALMVRMRERIEEPIAAILTINTISNTMGSALCGGIVARQSGDVAAGVFAAVFTLLVLLLSEIIPKSLGVRYAQRLAPWIAWPLRMMVLLSWPVARASRGLMNVLSGSGEHHIPTAEEILVLTQRARQGGAVRPQEQRWVENALQLRAITARDLMTPRTVVESLSAELTVTYMRETKREWVHTRLPLIEDDNPDSVVGFVHGKDVFRAVMHEPLDSVLTLRDLAQPIDFVPETIKGHRLLDKFIHERKHLVAVVDEYGGFEGIVTLEDVLECLLGSEIVDEHDLHPDMQQVARRRAQERARQMGAVDDAATDGRTAAPGETA